MYVVTVRFEVVTEQSGVFHNAVIQQAQNSLRFEKGCRQFDVCADPARPQLFFLYEKYDDRKAFDEHLASDHFKNFDATVTPWIAAKEVETWVEQQSM